MNLFPERGQIWFVDFTPTIGAEISKMRPALVISISEAGRLPLRVVVPITDWKPLFADFFWFIRLSQSKKNGLMKLSGADCFQIKSVSVQRFIRHLGNATEEELENAVYAVALCIGYGRAIE